MLSCVAICNLEGLALDVMGLILKHIKEKGPTATHLRGVIKNALHHNEFPYDWGELH